eukprot:CAMPEP_0181245182 /NCGR_PEP_ID=MMETSP1096-20121128/43277_1 /TAXON_ID=156174 ORGANISM="Chrysochromulina ericina, Strain CCMP281" /NCGR_SAMPLE_ID=MMETSP1096 /ASSEMBLY_ACC=CAM_ASM_000453 /LENGTH=244 /DNA_ID=CAMNT_0023341821 /DNA_START=56 /DNA_END=786 /DNA_ORIENTATION=-
MSALTEVMNTPTPSQAAPLEPGESEPLASTPQKQSPELELRMGATLRKIPHGQSWPELDAAVAKRQVLVEAAAARAAIEKEVQRRKAEAAENARRTREAKRAELLAKTEAARRAAEKAEEELREAMLMQQLRARKYWLNTESAFSTLRKPPNFGEPSDRLNPPRQWQTPQARERPWQQRGKAVGQALALAQEQRWQQGVVEGLAPTPTREQKGQRGSEATEKAAEQKTPLTQSRRRQRGVTKPP